MLLKINFKKILNHLIYFKVCKKFMRQWISELKVKVLISLILLFLKLLIIFRYKMIIRLIPIRILVVTKINTPNLNSKEIFSELNKYWLILYRMLLIILKKDMCQLKLIIIFQIINYLSVLKIQVQELIKKYLNRSQKFLSRLSKIPKLILKIIISN